MTTIAPQGYIWVWSKYAVARAEEQGLPPRIEGQPAGFGRTAKKVLVDKGILELRRTIL